MSLNAPYSLAQEPDGSIQISKSGTNPFWTEMHTRTSSHGTGGQQQIAPGAADHQNRTEENRESRGSNSYVPPDTVLAQTDHYSRRNLESANVPNDPEASSSSVAGPGYPAPADSSIIQIGIANDHAAKNQRPHSLQIATSRPAATDQEGQTPVKGILKKPSGSVSFDTTVQVSEGGIETITTTESTGFNESDYSVGNNFTSLHPQPDDEDDDNDDDTRQLIELEERCADNGKMESKGGSDHHHDVVRRPPPPRRTLQRLKTELDLNILAQNELELKANIFYHIGNPIKRWRVEKVVPGKLVLQLLKTFCLIAQVVLYTTTFPRKRAEFFYESREVFENLFLKDFDQTNPRDFYSDFNAGDILCQFNYTVSRYCELPNITIGGYDFAFDENNAITPVSMTLQQYAEAYFNTSTDTYILNGTIVTKTFEVECGQNVIERYINESQDRLFSRFIELEISFPVKNMRVIHPEKVECYLFMISIHFKVEDNSGEVVYYLREKHSQFNCQGNIHTHRGTFYQLYGILTVLDLIVLGMCVLSIYLTCCSLRRGYKLYRAIGGFYEKQLKIELSWWDRRSLFPIWHVINTISDLIIIAGSISKILLDFFVFDYSAPVRVLLGTAVIFQAMVILRYISYFKQLNALTRTMYLAFPELLKFLLCSGILFIAFAMTGWIVLGPFHGKFENLNSAIETLFGLLNGDDIYNTFIQIRPQDDLTAYVFSRIFLYVFLALFIYAVLNLFTSLIITAYEASQDWDTATRNEVRRFCFSGPLTPNGVALRDFGLTKKYVDPKLIKEKKRTSLKKRISYRLRSRAETLTAQY